MKYKYLLMEIDRDIKTMGRTLQPGCPSNQIDQLVKSVRETLGVTLPEGYIQFLSYTNGLMYNGLMIYASQETVLQGGQDVCIWGLLKQICCIEAIRFLMTFWFLDREIWIIMHSTSLIIHIV